MKKQISILLCFVIALTAVYSVSITSLASQTEDIPLTQLLDSDTYYSFDAASKTLTISGQGNTPDFSNTSGAVDSQPWRSWRSDGSIEHVVVEEGITSIGTFFFYFVTTADFSFPSTLKSFSASSMGYTNSIVNLVLPQGVEAIAKNAFYGCTALKSVTIPSSVTSIGESAFQGCKVLTSLTFEDMEMNVSIGKKAFFSCTSLLSVVFPKGATFESYSFGYSKAIAGGTYDSAFMYVYMNSPAHEYAESNYIDYAFIICSGDTFNLSYDADNLNKTYDFHFIPAVSGYYNFYSEGAVDVDCVLTDKDSNELASSADISEQDRNFLISEKMTAGEEYIFSVSSYMSKGAFTVTLIPRDVTITGKAVLMEAPDGSHTQNLPVSLVEIICNGETIAVTEKDGLFSITVSSKVSSITLSYAYGIDRVIDLSQNRRGTLDLGEVPIVCNDYNQDSCINAVDYAMLYKLCGEYDESNIILASIDYNNDGVLDDSDWKFAKNYFAYHKIDETIYNFN